MYYYSQSFEERDCLSWCYFFVPLFENTFLVLGFVLVCLVSCVTCQPLVLFSSGVMVIVFWILTCLQCPIPCHQYREMCDYNLECFTGLDMIWCWPAMAGVSLAFSYLFNLRRVGVISGTINCCQKKWERINSRSSARSQADSNNVSFCIQQNNNGQVKTVRTKSVKFKNGCKSV